MVFATGHRSKKAFVECFFFESFFLLVRESHDTLHENPYEKIKLFEKFVDEWMPILETKQRSRPRPRSAAYTEAETANKRNICEVTLFTHMVGI